MYFKAKPEVMELAKLLRNDMTYHEKLLWEKLKGKQNLWNSIQEAASN